MGIEYSTNAVRQWQLALAATACLLYFNTLFNSYNLDDELVTTEQNELVQQGLAAIPEIFSTHYLSWNDYKADYRPLVKASFALEYQLLGFNPTVSHLINILLFSLIVVVLIRWLKEIFPNTNVHLLGISVLLFCAHPVNTEVVASLKNRDELFSFLFVLGSFNLALRWIKTQNKFHLVFSLLLLLLSLFSKMSSVTWLPVLVGALIYKDIRYKKIAQLVVPMILLVAVYYAAVFGLLEGWGRDFVFIEVPYFEIGSESAKWASILASAGYYLKLLVYPSSLCCYYGFDQLPITDWGDWRVYASVLAYLLLGVLAIRGIWKKDIIGFGALILLCDLALFVNVLYPYTGIIGERVLFGSTLGLAMVVVGALSKTGFLKYPSIEARLRAVGWKVIVPAFLFVAGSWKTIDRNSYWKDRLTLFTEDAMNCDRSVKLQQLYAHHLRQNYLDEPDQFSLTTAKKVLSAYEKGIEIHDQWPVIHYGAGNVWFFDLQNPQKALPYYTRAVELNPNYTDALYDLLNAHLALANHKEAVKLLDTLTQKFPDDPSIYDRVLKSLFGSNKLDLVVPVNERFEQAFPELHTPFIYHGNIELSRGDTSNALINFEKALELKPDYDELREYVNQLHRSTRTGESSPPLP